MRNLLGRLRRSGSRSLVEQLATLTSVGDGSTLTLDFTTGVLDSRLTFTRSSTATYINSSGYITSIGAAPTNDPTKARFDHDPTTQAPRGLLIEGQAVNIMFRSQAINTSPWFNAGTMTVSETGAGSPANDATSNVVTWTNGTGAGGAWLQQNVAVSAGSLVVGNAYTWSVWLKSRGGRRVNVFAVLQGASGNREIRVDFGVSPPTVTSTVATGWTSIQTPTIVEYPNGWYKVTTGGTLPSGATSVNFGFSNSDAVPASGTNGFEAWGYQLEAGSGASSYIPTGSGQGTRNQDQMQMTDLASLGFNTSAGTLTINGTYNKDANSAAYPRSIRFMGTSVQSMAMITSGKTLFGNTPNTSGGSYFEASRTLASAGAFKFGWTLTTAVNPALASATVSLNGSSTSITPLGQGAIVNPTSLQFLYGAGAATDYPSMNISSLKYWPYATTAADLNARTSL